MKINSRFYVGYIILVLLSGCGGGTGSDSASASASNKAVTRQLDVMASIASDYTTVIQQLYISYFGRPADTGGLSNFQNQLVALGAPTDIQNLTQAYSTNSGIRSLIDSFGVSAESTALYSGDNTTFVTAIYNNVLNRSPDAGGITFWVNALDNGSLTKANASLSITAGALANSSVQGQADALLVNKKNAIAKNFTTALANAPVNGYSGLSAAAQARAMLASVTAASDTTSFQTTIAALVSNLAIPSIPNMVTTFAGSVASGRSFNSTGTDARFAGPEGIALDVSGNIYVSDLLGLIRKITPAGVVTTLAGGGSGRSTDGTGTNASFNSARGVAVDRSGNVYVAESYYSLIRKITPAGVVTTFAGTGSAGNADGVGTNASFNNPIGIAVDASGTVYVADSWNSSIRKITPAGVVTTLAGGSPYGTGQADGIGASATFSIPEGIVVDASGTVYVTDWGNGLIRKITPAGVVTTLAGGFGRADGIGTNAGFNGPKGIAVDAAGNLYVADIWNNLIRKITPVGVVTTLAGSINKGSADGIGTNASFNRPEGIAIDAFGNLYVADTQNYLIRKIQSGL